MRNGRDFQHHGRGPSTATTLKELTFVDRIEFMAQMEQQGGAVKQYLNSSERVLDSFQAESEFKRDDPPLYVVTSERFIEFRRSQNNDSRDQVTLKATPIEGVQNLEITRVSGGSDHDDEQLIAGGIAMIAAFVLVIFPVPGELRGIMFGAGGLFAVIGIILLILGFGSTAMGEIEIEISFEESKRAISLPLEAEEFAQSVSKRMGQSA